MQFLPQLVGNQFRQPEEREAFKTLVVGTVLRLERDKANAYDPNAVRVLLDQEEGTPLFIGFVDKENAANMAPLLDATPGAVAEGWVPEVVQCEVFDLVNPKKPTLIVEITTGWEIPTSIQPAGEEDEDGYAADLSLYDDED